MSGGRTTLADRLSDAATTVLGAILALTPAGLWIAWTPEVLFIVAAAAIASAGILILLAERSAPPAAEQRVVLPDEFIAEVHEIFPLTYHHSLRETARFRRAMARLSRMLRASPAAPPR